MTERPWIEACSIGKPSLEGKVGDEPNAIFQNFVAAEDSGKTTRCSRRRDKNPEDGLEPTAALDVSLKRRHRSRVEWVYTDTD